MSKRTVEQALARAVIKQEKVRHGLPVHIDEMDIALLATEVARLRAESHQLRMIAIDITPYLHLETCEKCKQQKMCVGGTKSGEPPTSFFECEDCSREIKRNIEARMKQAIMSTDEAHAQLDEDDD